jgi:hypothetical protein
MTIVVVASMPSREMLYILAMLKRGLELIKEVGHTLHFHLLTLSGIKIRIQSTH